MSYFRADAMMIAQMVEKDCLRYNVDNIASLVTLFCIPGRLGLNHYIVAVVFGEQAEHFSRLELNDSWFEVKGQLRDSTPEFEGYALAKISLKVETISPIPTASKSIIRCELIGRATHDPEHIIKTNSFEFIRFGLAVNRKNVDKANYYNISVFKPKLIEAVNKALKKGQTVFVAGNLTFFEKGSPDSVHAAIKLEQMLLIDRQ